MREQRTRSTVSTKQKKKQYQLKHGQYIHRIMTAQLVEHGATGVRSTGHAAFHSHSDLSITRPRRQYAVQDVT